MLTELTVARSAEFFELCKESNQQGMQQRFEEQVHLHSENIALRPQAAALIYAETKRFDNSITAQIISAAGKKLAQVSMLLSNTSEMIVANLASLKAHKAYVPLNPVSPETGCASCGQTPSRWLR